MLHVHVLSVMPLHHLCVQLHVSMGHLAQGWENFPHYHQLRCFPALSLCAMAQQPGTAFVAPAIDMQPGWELVPASTADGAPIMDEHNHQMVVVVHLVDNNGQPEWVAVDPLARTLMDPRITDRGMVPLPPSDSGAAGSGGAPAGGPDPVGNPQAFHPPIGSATQLVATPAQLPQVQTQTAPNPVEIPAAALAPVGLSAGPPAAAPAPPSQSPAVQQMPPPPPVGPGPLGGPGGLSAANGVSPIA